jgi:aspartate/methionine/tyrosine aminotransferase
MRFNRFLLDEWMNQYQHSEPPMEFDLSTSTGPVWTLRELLALGEPDELNRLLETSLDYTRLQGSAPLCEAIATLEGVDAADVQVTTGAAEALLLLFGDCAEPGANVVVSMPAFPSFYEMPRALGTEVRFYHQRRENQFRIVREEIEALVDSRTKLLLVNSPHNPTGATIDADEIERLHDFAVERGIQFVVDQVFHPVYHGRAPASPSTTASTAASATRLPHATVLGDFSKALCLGGLRIGWIVERDRSRMERYRTARAYSTVSGAAMSEALAVLALRNHKAIYERVRAVTKANLALLDRFFERHASTLSWIRPEGGMTAFPWLNSGEESRPLCIEAAKNGVLLDPGDCFDAPAHFRLGFGAVSKRFGAALERLSEVIERRSVRRAVAD